MKTSGWAVGVTTGVRPVASFVKTNGTVVRGLSPSSVLPGRFDFVCPFALDGRPVEGRIRPEIDDGTEVESRAVMASARTVYRVRKR